jgi:WD40 repeat protein
VGHTNKINHLTFEKNYLFSASMDCTVRQWNVASETCIRIYKFADPIFYSCVHEQHNLLFTGSWDKIVRAIDLKTGEVDRSFVASRDAIKCLHLFDKWLFVSGCDPIVRAYDLVTGNIKTFEGHLSWVLSIKTLVNKKEDGSIKSEWLFTSSDDNTIRIWDIKTCQCLEELIGHKNGVTCMTFVEN